MSGTSRTAPHPRQFLNVPPNRPPAQGLVVRNIHPNRAERSGPEHQRRQLNASGNIRYAHPRCCEH
eukprot:8667935-Alexandrium_andersonii.AAC.1